MRRVSTHLFQGLFAQTAVCGGLILFIACSSSSFTSSAKLSPAGSKTTVQQPAAGKSPAGSQPPAESSPVLPPVEVTGSFLTGFMQNESGEPLANAGLKIVANSYQTTTSQNGQFKLPVSKIPADTFELRVTNVSNGPDSDSSEYTVETTLPSDISSLVQTEKTNTTETRDLAQKIGLTLPRNTVPFTAEDSSVRQKYILSAVSLPKADSGVSVGVLQKRSDLTGVSLGFMNESHGGAVRLKWSAPAGANVTILLGTVKSVIESVQKDLAGNYPSQSLPVLAFEACNDSGYSSASSGPLAATGLCGIKFETGGTATLDQTNQYFFRMIIKDGNNHYISAVETQKYIAPAWYVYHTEIESCWPKYYGPSLLTAGGNIDPLKLGSMNKPACTEANRGTPHCTSSEDGSPSKCFNCESSLLLCR